MSYTFNPAPPMQFETGPQKPAQTPVSGLATPGLATPGLTTTQKVVRGLGIVTAVSVGAYLIWKWTRPEQALSTEEKQVEEMETQEDEGTTPEPPATPPAYLRSGEVLMPAGLLSENGQYKLLQQADGQICVYQIAGDTLLWTSGAHIDQSMDRCYCVLLDNGELQTKIGTGPGDPFTQVVWTSNSAGMTGSYFLMMQDDGNAAIYFGSGPHDNKGYVWGTGIRQ